MQRSLGLKFSLTAQDDSSLLRSHPLVFQPLIFAFSMNALAMFIEFDFQPPGNNHTTALRTPCTFHCRSVGRLSRLCRRIRNGDISKVILTNGAYRESVCYRVSHVEKRMWETQTETYKLLR